MAAGVDGHPHLSGLLRRSIASTTMILHPPPQPTAGLVSRAWPTQTRTVSIRLEAQPPPGIPGLVIERKLAYGDGRKSPFNGTSSLIQPTAMAGTSFGRGSIERAIQGCAVTDSTKAMTRIDACQSARIRG